ncbi:molybdenum cofactor guanylyltransferase [Nodosilinea sp. E11]|uniref:molybdenum cofactor guanylyltransferase n=1 Tax=Nodosilinea sp. E11 TaxID=3037479 RepID=UPI00293431DA|nr:molybdenum cofactor guanylyltransferase [Nodosilinea sp. E11]WOD41362.1 molybdenum cofactor guanylyltransferase [Nodosilinea sp. E11]
MVALAAIILAGGRSSRMGHDKALISLGAETLIERLCRVASACAEAVYVVTPWGDRYRPLVATSVTFISENPGVDPSQKPPGPVVALVQALEQIQTDPAINPEWVLLLACDLPNVSAAVLQTWRDQLAKLSPDALAYLPQRQGRWEPLCGFYRTSALADLQRYVAAGGRSFQPWLNTQTVAPIALTAQTEAMLTNLNTPADLAQWQKGS